METSPGNVQTQPNSDSLRSSTSASGSESHDSESTSTSASSSGSRSSESTNSPPAQTDDTPTSGAEGPAVQDPAEMKILFGSSSDYSKSLDGEDSEEERPEWDKEDYLTPGSAQEREMEWWETHEHLKRQWRKERATNPKFRGLARGQ
ncbi:hypothetical protein PFICI_13530 [Pestalotiopsis fici W106-1]|uniref:Uncharacterized protein n=1 Tax=Pestalotiopsis fici (strain W106-1 / CGMCC3.15140) TaxID=1229662 RepID=W3WQE0_PESFW|nr:uncharacterized protein PFICI_13530 [Pestalotiopsis fici W106-1]ETS75046.1 hypothetical protein PFICI_13530 [Pestalotiopsis fici W106-1]